MKLPKNEFSFDFNSAGEKTRIKYVGGFTVKCLLSAQEIVEVGLRLDSYNRGSTTLPSGVQRLNRAIAELEVRIVTDERSGQPKAPSWWRDSDGGRNLLDTDIVFEVYLKALEAEDEYEKQIKVASGEAEKTIETAAAEKSSEA